MMIFSYQITFYALIYKDFDFYFATIVITYSGVSISL
jgi:hypothetical protein